MSRATQEKVFSVDGLGSCGEGLSASIWGRSGIGLGSWHQESGFEVEIYIYIYVYLHIYIYI